MKVSIAVFACNEQGAIRKCIDSILTGRTKNSDEIKIHVMANGCTDRTVDLVHEMHVIDERIVVEEISFGDKSNAWNHYVHHVAPQANTHFFVDGDVRCTEDAIMRSHDLLINSAHIHAIAGAPQSGRNRKKYLGYIREYGWLFGNSYAISGTHLSKIKEKDIRIPVGALGDDHFISCFARSSLEDPWSDQIDRVFCDEKIGYIFESLNPFRANDIRLYFNRRANYAIRQQQIRRLEHLRPDELPDTTAEVDSLILNELESSPKNLINPIRKLVIKKLNVRRVKGYEPDHESCTETSITSKLV
jgi:glycosyltransferase involved in cell wall biosynthesis